MDAKRGDTLARLVGASGRRKRVLAAFRAGLAPPLISGLSRAASPRDRRAEVAAADAEYQRVRNEGTAMRADSRDASGGEDEAKTEAIDAFRAVPHDSLDQLTPDQFVPAKRVFPAAGSVPEDAPVGATKHLPKFIIPDSLAKDVATGVGRA